MGNERSKCSRITAQPLEDSHRISPEECTHWLFSMALLNDKCQSRSYQSGLKFQTWDRRWFQGRDSGFACDESELDTAVRVNQTPICNAGVSKLTCICEDVKLSVGRLVAFRPCIPTRYLQQRDICQVLKPFEPLGCFCLWELRVPIDIRSPGVETVSVL